MRTADGVVTALRARGELWDVAPGLVGLRGNVLTLLHRIEREIALLTQLDSPEEWSAPPALAMQTLDRAEYFVSFPFWLTAASHLPDDEQTLEQIATADDAVGAARDALQPSGAAMQPALCYHVYERLSGRRVTTTRIISLSGTCWRQEGARLAPLERQWAFTMRELICLGTAEDVEDFRQRGMRAAGSLATRLDLDAGFLVATDPFFAPTARGKAVLQRMKALKHELALPIGGERSTAAASFNNHERFFGERFDITLDSGEPVSTACVAFGIERWLLAFLVAHGIDRVAWPSLDAAYSGSDA